LNETVKGLQKCDIHLLCTGTVDPLLCGANIAFHANINPPPLESDWEMHWGIGSWIWEE